MFYQKDIQTVLKECQTSQYGLSESEVQKRHQRYGYNLLNEQHKDHLLLIFIKQFQDLLVIILILAAIISGFSHQIESTIVILVVIVLNAFLGTIQTLKAEKSLENLKKLTIPQVKVIRQNVLQEIDATTLTVGDIVHIEAGDMISGDGRLIQCASLQVNESHLTGEVESIEKITDVINQEVIIADQKNMVFSGSLVTNGTGEYIVTAIGMQTEIGKIATLLNETKHKKTPLQQNLDDFSQQLSFLIIVISIIVLILNLFLAKVPLLDALMIAVALAVAAIPEALGSIVTIVLSISTQKLASENAIIKNLNSVESLGCVSVICSDKTGTLTQNKMTLQNIYFYHHFFKMTQLHCDDHDHLVLLKACLFCNNAVVNDGQRIGDPIELALLDLVNQYTKQHVAFQNTTIRKQELPFDSARKMMSVSSVNHLYTKGAPDIILQKCESLLINGRKERLTDRHKQTILIQNQKYANEGLRVLAFAYKDFHSSKLTIQDENHFTFISLVSFMDPPRLESAQAVKQCQMAGIKPIMITGDHVITARSIAEKIGIYHDGDLCIDGQTLQQMSDQKLHEKLPQICVYARVTPEHKMRIIKAWQKRGAIVAMTGDGVNDAPALKQSDIGIAMGKSGTEVSKDAAHMILTDDHFSTIVKAIMTGRHVYQNIKNAILYLLSGNLAGIICVLITSLLILPNPFYPVHLLFMNLITDSLPAIAIGMEKGHHDVLKEKPRVKNESLLDRTAFFEIAYEGMMIALCTMCAYLMGLKGHSLTASTMAFSTICLARLLHGFNCRSHLPLTQIGIFSNHMTIFSFLIGFFLLHMILFIPFLQHIFMIHPITIIQLLCIYGFALIPTLIIQTRKMLKS